jgi:galactokinase
MSVPVTTSLVDIYPEDAIISQTKRWETLRTMFEAEYGKPPDFVSRSPGRVNLIGEHIDYSLYQVLPMAITMDVLVAVAVRPASPNRLSTIRLSNVEATKFPSREFTIPVKGDIEIDSTSHEWSNYFKAGLQGACQVLRARDDKFASVGMDVLVHGTVPNGSGLSSSTAFVCASALAVMAANSEMDIKKHELCQLTIVSERSVGTNGGGMDQAASVFSLAGSATYISFVPDLSAEPVKFPSTDPELTFLVAQSFVDSFKHVTAPVCYNLRVVECSMASALLAKILGVKNELPVDESPLKISLRGLQNRFFEQKDHIADNFQTTGKDFQDQLEQLVALVGKCLTQEEGYTREEIADLLDISVEDLEERYMSRFPVRADRFKLRQRALHVFSEALRVTKFKSILSSSDALISGDGLLQDLGNLLNEAQSSCRELYDCSCPELDELCSLAYNAGAFGSRLTGAGWGGCSVHLVPKDKVDNVKQAWIENYYKRKWPEMSVDTLNSAIVVSEPGSGSFLFKTTSESSRP